MGKVPRPVVRLMGKVLRQAGKLTDEARRPVARGPMLIIGTATMEVHITEEPWQQERPQRLLVTPREQLRVMQAAQLSHPQPIQPFPALQRLSQREEAPTTSAAPAGTLRLTMDRELLTWNPSRHLVTDRGQSF